MEKVMGGVPPKPHTPYLSRYEIGEDVVLKFEDGSTLGNCSIQAIIFTKPKVFYDIEVKWGESSTILEKVDSVIVCDI